MQILSFQPVLTILESILRQMCEHLKSEDSAFIFQRPVDNAQFPKYRSIISSPMDLSTISRRIDANYYNDFSTFHQDVMKIFYNGCTFNPCNDIWYQQCVVLKTCYMNMVEGLEKAGLIDKLNRSMEMPCEKEVVVKIVHRGRDDDNDDENDDDNDENENEKRPYWIVNNYN